MKNFSKVMLGCIFTVLIVCSVQSVDADHHLSGNSIFADLTRVNIVDEWDSEYQIYLHVEVRNTQGQLVSISEASIGRLIPHEITDHVFNEKMDKIEIVTIDNIKYEKAQYTFSPTLEQRWMATYPIFEQPIIKYNMVGNALVQMNKQNKDYSLWKIHYCEDFSKIGHDGLQCVPVFQALIPTITLEPGDVITHHWTILRELN